MGRHWLLVEILFFLYKEITSHLQEILLGNAQYD